GCACPRSARPAATRRERPRTRPNDRSWRNPLFRPATPRAAGRIGRARRRSIDCHVWTFEHVRPADRPERGCRASTRQPTGGHPSRAAGQAADAPRPCTGRGNRRALTAMELLPDLCEPVRTPAPYISGKRNLSRRLATLIAARPCTTYAEPFVGMGGVFLRRTRRATCEVINDISEDVATFVRILQRHYVPVMDMLRFQLTTRAGFERLMKVDPSTLTDLERAARFLYLQRLAFGGKVAGRNFGMR